MRQEEEKIKTKLKKYVSHVTDVALQSVVRLHSTTGAVLGRQSLQLTTATTNMAAANFVVISMVITNGEGCALTGTADIDQ